VKGPIVHVGEFAFVGIGLYLASVYTASVSILRLQPAIRWYPFGASYVTHMSPEKRLNSRGGGPNMFPISLRLKECIRSTQKDYDGKSIGLAFGLCRAY